MTPNLIEVVDNFCGAGGTSTGVKQAARKLGLKVRLVAVNHWKVAIATHSANHMDAEHYCQAVGSVNPLKVVPGGRLKLMVASPECTHHSRARGGKPRSEQHRADAWELMRWREPLKWNAAAEAEGRKHRVFCSSMADVFEDHPTVAKERLKLWPLIEATPWLEWQLLTKRPENIIGAVPQRWLYAPPFNVWYGTTIENQDYLDARATALLSVPGYLHFFSCEPLLGEIILKGYRPKWIIAGGESGPHHRPLNLDYARSLRDQCRASGISFFFKQVGGLRPDSGGDLLDGERIQEMPRVRG